MMTEQPQTVSPDGRFVILMTLEEMRMSHWIYHADLWTTDPVALQLSIGDDLWSADRVDWAGDSASVTLVLRRYPGDAPAVTVTLYPRGQMSLVETTQGTTSVPFANLSEYLDRYYRSAHASAERNSTVTS